MSGPAYAPWPAREKEEKDAALLKLFIRTACLDHTVMIDPTASREVVCLKLRMFGDAYYREFMQKDDGGGTRD